MDKIEEKLLQKIISQSVYEADAYNIRKDGKSIDRRINTYITISTKEDKPGINVYVKEGTLFGRVDIPVLITKSGLNDCVYNDFYIGKNANVTIVAGCAIHNDCDKNSRHDGIHRFFIESGCKVKYIEKHYGEGKGSGNRDLNPTTEIVLEDNAYMEMNTIQIKGVNNTNRKTIAELHKNATLVIEEKILTSDSQKAVTTFEVSLNGENSSTHVVSRSIAQDNSSQEFISNIIGNTKCYGHVECDAIIKDGANVKAIPQIFAKSSDSKLIHEASIGKIAGEELMKLMSLGLNEKDAEDMIIEGFLK